MSRIRRIKKFLERNVRRRTKRISSSYCHVKGFEYRNIRSGEKQDLIPNLIIIGAQKSATSSLHHYLHQHPGIFMSYPLKEPGFFLPDKFYQENGKLFAAKGPEDLLKNFMLQGYNGQQYIGESSTYYTFGHRNASYGITEHMHTLSPSARLIYIVRDPIDRIVSQYNHIIRKGYASDNFDTHLQNNPTLVETSHYWNQLRPYINAFGKKNIKIVAFEELIGDPQSVLDEIFEFLDIDNIKIPNTEAKNQYENKKLTSVPTESFDSATVKRLQKQRNMLERFAKRRFNWKTLDTLERKFA